MCMLCLSSWTTDQICALLLFLFTYNFFNLRWFYKENRAIDISTGGRESLRDGKSLYVSGHIGSVQYHGVGGNIPYCFMRSVCIRETSLREVPYKLWIIIHKEKQVLVESFCTCPAGLRGTCKHVSALCHYIIAIAARGENTAVTEQRQTWNAPPKNLHPPEFMHNINIRKVQGNCVIENEERRPKRFKYDPRAPNDRGERSIYQLDMDGLRDATNGAAGILTYFPGVPDNQEPCMADLSVVLEEIVEHEPVACLPPTLTELAKTSSESSLFEECLKPLSQSEVQTVSNATQDQAESNLWFDYRAGRITASNLATVVKKVNPGTGELSQRNDSLIKTIMGYYPAVSSAAIDWGKYNESSAVKMFLKANRHSHKNMSTKKCGVVLCDTLPILAATPDAMVQCSCCGLRPLEVKNPYTYRGLSVNKLAEQPDSCLHITTDGQIKLKRDHPYYYQVQAQLLCTHADIGYFAVKTASPYSNFHCEEICIDTQLLNDVVDKVKRVFEAVIMPELIHGNLRKRMEANKTQEPLPPAATQEPLPPAST
ncbi:Hypp9666 [Branchiostoma lanceolatum]|uniref:Hypp9666 protein n=2 Tax=Branchiostoma lanceolatum TaxID=7740 RepID=A0A8S4MP00_BRALA|nr:Hypp9666 [Branchiostoma lanceolatum]